MLPLTVMLVLEYDGALFAGWQRQPSERTVQGELESALERICVTPVPVTGAGRTDSGVHARGQAAGLTVARKWTPATLRRALNAVLPGDLWVASAHAMQPGFHARFNATSRSYSYNIGTDDAAHSPFRKRYVWAVQRPLDHDVLHASARQLLGEHTFRAFSVLGTAPVHDNHVCVVHSAQWEVVEGGLVFRITANRFLHHMVRFLTGTMIDAASGKRSAADFARLLLAPNNNEVSAPAPPHALFLESVTYPDALYDRET